MLPWRGARNKHTSGGPTTLARSKSQRVLVGACRITLHLPHSQSLKEKRSTVKSVVARLQNEFHVSAAEVATLDAWQIATIGIACVGNSAPYLDEVLAKAVRFVERQAVEAELTD